MEKFPSISLESFYKNTTLHIIVLSDGVVVPKTMSIADPLPTLRNLREFFKAIKAFAEDKTYIGTMGSETAMLIHCDCAEFIMNLGTLMGVGERPYSIVNDAATVKEILSKKKSYDYAPDIYAALAKKGYLPKIDLPKTKPSTPEDESEEATDEALGKLGKLGELMKRAEDALAAAGAVPEDDDESIEEESEEDEDEYEEDETEEEEEEVESDEEETVRKTASASATPEYSGTPIEKKIYKKIVDAVHPANEEEDKVVRGLTKDIVKSILKDMGVL